MTFRRASVILLLFPFAPSAMAQTVPPALLSHSLVCTSGGYANNTWATVETIYFTDKNMFMQAATKNMKNGTIDSGGAGLGQVFYWNKKYHGNVGIKDQFDSFASSNEKEITYELEYTATIVFLTTLQ